MYLMTRKRNDGIGETTLVLTDDERLTITDALKDADALYKSCNDGASTYALVLRSLHEILTRE